MNIKTLIDYFRNFTEQHPILRTFSWGNLSDYSREDYITQYPALHIVPLPATLGNTSTDMTFSVLIYDLLNEYVGDPINSNQLDSMALCQDILNDFVNEFINQLTDYGYYLQMPITFSPFVDRFAESVCGVEAQIVITMEQTSCIPASIVPVPLNPNAVSGLFAWYDLQDADTITLTGGTSITQLLDKSGNNYTLTPFNTPPTYQKVPSGNLTPFYALYDTNMTGLQHNLSSPVSFPSGYTMFLVSDWENTDSIRSVFGVVTGNTFSTLFDLRDAGINIYRLTASVYQSGQNYLTQILGGSIDPSNNAFITTSLQDGLTSDMKMYMYGGVYNYEDLVASPITTDTTDFDYIILGDIVPGGTGDLNICEAIIYDRKLTDDEYNGVLKYLKDKYRQPYWL